MSADHVKLQFETVCFIEYLKGKFEHDDIKNFPCTIGLNEKKGWITESLRNYLYSIVPLYPVVLDRKIDLGPDQLN